MQLTPPVADTRSLNNTVYWLAQIAGSGVFGFALDYPKLRRPTRAIIAWVALFVLTFAIWSGGYVFQRTYNRTFVEPLKDNDPWFIDLKEGRYVGPMFLYIFYGFYDAAWQTSVYW